MFYKKLPYFSQNSKSINDELARTIELSAEK